ncbi:transmembrane protein [Salvia divinorum]|uniref:Transmembrane protein n=1 Tax=Salvia divinorum TaxID=28513 RepID=A0ABD1FXM8_SALDI
MRNFSIALVLALSILLCSEMGKGSRLLHDELETLKAKGIFINSLEKGPVPPSDHSSCTFIPGSSGGSGCPIKEIHFAGARLRRRAPASPPSFGAMTTLEK